jgi:diguanylate cyclase
LPKTSLTRNKPYSATNKDIVAPSGVQFGFVIMSAPVRQPSAEAPKYAGQRSFREVCQAAVRVFNLMDKYHTAPYPNAYAVLFAYATGSDDALVAEINDLLQLKDQLSPYDIESLFQEYLADNAQAYVAQDIGQAIGTEIGSVLEIIEKGLRQSDDFTTSLDTFAERVPQATTEGGLAEVVNGLLEENRRMASLTRELNSGLAKSQSMITVLNQQLEEAQAQAARDPLTGAHNRRAFEKRLEASAAHAVKSREGFCVVLAEIDDFASLVSAEGAPLGDIVLQGFTRHVTAGLSDNDMIARYGEQAFALILTERDLMSAYNLLIKVKHGFKLTSFVVPETRAKVTGVTASFGLARLDPGMSAGDVIKQADVLLRSAQESGRNQVKARGIA